MSKTKPYYKYIYEEVKSNIKLGKYDNIEYLPSEASMSKEYDVDRVTVRRALQLLVDENLITKEAGVGSKIVKKEIVEPKLNINPNISYSPCNNIAFVLPARKSNKISQPFISAVFDKFQEICKEHGYNLFYTSLCEDDDIPTIFSTIRGAVFVSEIYQVVIDKVLAMNIPAIAVSTTSSSIRSILSDNISGSVIAVEHLISLGHKKIAYINGTKSYLNAIERYEGYVRTLGNHSIPINEKLIINGDWDFNSALESVQKLIDSKEEFTAIYAANDMMALGAMRALAENGLSVPRDVSVIGFDNVEQCRYSLPALTTINIDRDILANQIMKNLLELIEHNDHVPIKTIIPVNLRKRESTAVNKNT